jgi:hypothetical protein
VTAVETTCSGLIAALEQTWTDIRHRTPELPEVVVVTGTGLSSSALHIDAKWATSAPTTGSKATPPNKAHAPLWACRRPELFVSGECLAEGSCQTLQTMLHEAVHALAHVRGVKDTSRGGKYHTSASSSPWPASSAWPGQTASGRIR